MYYSKYFEGIKKETIKNVNVIVGEEIYLIDKFIGQIKEHYIMPDFEDFNYNFLDGKQIKGAEMIAIAETLPFMADKKVVVVEDFLAMSSKGGEAEDLDELKKYMESANPSTILIFSFKELSLDKRKKVTKEILKKADLIEFPKLKEDDLRKWISKKINQYNKKILDKDIVYMVENLGYQERNSEKTLYDIENELIKVVGFVEDSPYITEADLRATLPRNLQNNIFELIDFISQGKKLQAMKLLDDMLLNNEPEQLILFMLIKHYRQAIYVKHLSEKGYGQMDIADKLGINKFVVSKLLQQSKKESVKYYQSVYRKAYSMDKKIKMGEMDSRIGIEVLISTL